MSKYDGLGIYLSRQSLTEIPMTFTEIEQVTGVRLPPKAQHHRAWWSNNPTNNVMTKVWLAAGYETSQVNMAEQKLVFRRVAAKSPGHAPGMQESARMFQSQPATGRHPIFGALKDSFTIQPGWNPENPALEADDLKALDAGIERTAALIDRGLGS